MNIFKPAKESVDFENLEKVKSIRYSGSFWNPNILGRCIYIKKGNSIFVCEDVVDCNLLDVNECYTEKCKNIFTEVQPTGWMSHCKNNKNFEYLRKLLKGSHVIYSIHGANKNSIFEEKQFCYTIGHGDWYDYIGRIFYDKNIINRKVFLIAEYKTEQCSFNSSMCINYYTEVFMCEKCLGGDLNIFDIIRKNKSPKDFVSGSGQLKIIRVDVLIEYEDISEEVSCMEKAVSDTKVCLSHLESVNKDVIVAENKLCEIKSEISKNERILFEYEEKLKLMTIIDTLKKDIHEYTNLYRITTSLTVKEEIDNVIKGKTRELSLLSEKTLP